MPEKLSTYDFAIIGTGSAGLQLAYAMANDPWFSEKQILMIDRVTKSQNDKTWCFWEQGHGKWDEIVQHTWHKAEFHGPKKSKTLDLSPYHYKMVRSIDFYNYVLPKLNGLANFHFLTEEVASVTSENNSVSITTQSKSIQATVCFDSRIPKAFFKGNGNDAYLRISQHFIGHVLRFEKNLFDPKTFTMMDFRLRHDDLTAFMYILPIAKNEALLEYTFFSGETYKSATYNNYIEAYIQKYLPDAGSYEIIESEQGIIPMSNFPFHQYSTKNMVKIGTAGSWVRPSTGYSFRKTDDYVTQIIKNLKAGIDPNKNLFKSKYFLYDTLLLDILERNNTAGPKLFETMYFNNSIRSIFAFLDGKTGFGQDLRIMASFNPIPFMCSLCRRYILRNKIKSANNKAHIS